MTPRHVRGLKRGVPVPLECAILNVPFGNTAVSTLLPGWLTPPAVNAPVTMMASGAVGAGDVVTSWKCSNPEVPAPVAWLALAAVRPAAATAPAAATTLTPARILLLSFIMVRTSPCPARDAVAQPGSDRHQASTMVRRPDRTPSPHCLAAPPRAAPLRVGRASSGRD